MLLSRKVNGVFHPSIIEQWPGGGYWWVEEGQEQLWYKVEPMEISGRGQKWHFGKVSEGV